MPNLALNALNGNAPSLTLVEGEWSVKIVEGWRKIDNQRGYINETTGQNLAVKKKEFGEHYLVLLFAHMRSENEGRTISPEYETESRAQAFAMDWMNKHPEGID